MKIPNVKPDWEFGVFNGVAVVPAPRAGAPTWDNLSAFLVRGTRLETDNYRGAPDAYRADRRRIERDRADARELIRWAQVWGVEPAAVAHQLSRLTWNDSHGWDYCAGQYYPVEVCGAVAQAVSGAIIDHHREKALANPPIDTATGRAVENPCAGLFESISAYIAACGGPGSRRLARWFR